MSENTAIKPTGFLSGRVLSKNTGWNLLGQAAPILVSFIAIPIIIRELGTDRFGILTLVWTFIGYFSLFDFGIGRALTHLVAKSLGVNRDEEIPTLVWTSLLLMLILGMFGTVIVILISPWIVNILLKIPENLQFETLKSFYLLAICIPVVIITTGLRGILEAYQRFGLINVIRIGIALFMYLGPLLTLAFSHSLLPTVAVLVLGRLVALIAHAWLCASVIPHILKHTQIKGNAMKPLLGFGGWMTVSNIISPVMSYMDRFLISGLISVAVVAYYTTPYQVASQLTIIPAAVIGVLFPAFSTELGRDRARSELLFSRGLKYLVLILFPIVIILFAFSKEVIHLWLGAEFADQSAPVLRWLTVAFFINSLAYVPFALVQAAGRSDLTAKVHLFELPLYILTLFWLTKVMGIEGTAIAWTFRAVLDATLQFSLARRYLPNGSRILKQVIAAMIATFANIGIITLLTSVVSKSLFLIFVILVFGIATWLVFLVPSERILVKRILRVITFSTKPTR